MFGLIDGTEMVPQILNMTLDRGKGSYPHHSNLTPKNEPPVYF